jgi:DNA-binding transcriptional LysR family regulator
LAAKYSRIVDRALTRLKLKQLRLLVAVGKHGNIQAAARELHVSQPAATKMIQELELDFEVKLFERTNRGVIPTVYGEAMIRHGKLIFAQISNAAQELDDLTEGTSGRVVIGTLLAASSQLLPLAIEQVLSKRPNVTIKVVEGTNEVLMPGLRAGEIDLIVGRLPIHRHRDKLAQIPLFSERIQLLVGSSHPLCKKTNVTFNDLKNYGWILPPIETSLRSQIDRYFVDMEQYHPPVTIESVSYLTNRGLLAGNSNLIAVMPAHIATHDVRLGLLQYLSFKLPFETGSVGISYRGEDQLSPAGNAVLSALSSVAETL